MLTYMREGQIRKQLAILNSPQNGILPYTEARLHEFIQKPSVKLLLDMPYDFIHNHHSMFFDRTRNNAYFHALRSVIKPSSVVLDLGAGLGIQGLLAAKLGAKKVYMVEPKDVIHVAKKLVVANGFADRIECIQGLIEEIKLPEQVDVIVSVFTGNFLLQEDLLPSLFYARDTYLKPGGYLIPDAAVMVAVPIALPKFYEEQIDIWSQSYFDLNVSPVRQYAANSIYYNRHIWKTATYLANPLPLTEFDFRTAQGASCEATVEYTLTDEGACHGLAGWFNIQIGNSWLSTAPNSPKVHWTPAFLPLDPPLDLCQGETLHFYLSRPAFGHWSWRVGSSMDKQMHSTFISQTLSGPLANNRTHPIRSPHGEHVFDILACFDGKSSIQEIVAQVAAKHPKLKQSPTQLTQLVTELARQYSK
ncbi:MAG: class I SAM-dependent methyltransferase [Chloroflexota bacterium]